MSSLFFVFGSALGAVLSWFVSCKERRRSTVAALNGVAAGLLGILMSASGGTMAPVTEAGLGLLSTAAPLTLCMTPLRPVATGAEFFPAVGRLAATLALALVYGISCATVGFMSAESVRDISSKENDRKAADYLIRVSLEPSETPSAALDGCS